MTLKDAIKGKEYLIDIILLDQPIKQRLEVLGLIKGTTVRKINEALDGSIIFIVRGTRLAIGKDIAKQIVIEDNPFNNGRRRHGTHDNQGNPHRGQHGLCLEKRKLNDTGKL